MLTVATAFAMVGCERPAVVDGKPVFENRKVYTGEGVIYYIVFDGHEYVRYKLGENGGIIHSPKCKCMKHFKKEY